MRKIETTRVRIIVGDIVHPYDEFKNTHSFTVYNKNSKEVFNALMEFMKFLEKISSHSPTIEHATPLFIEGKRIGRKAVYNEIAIIG